MQGYTFLILPSSRPNIIWRKELAMLDEVQTGDLIFWTKTNCNADGAMKFTIQEFTWAAGR